MIIVVTKIVPCTLIKKEVSLGRNQSLGKKIDPKDLVTDVVMYTYNTTHLNKNGYTITLAFKQILMYHNNNDTPQHVNKY